MPDWQQAIAVAWPLLVALLLGLLLRHVLLAMARRASARADTHTFARVVRVSEALGLDRPQKNLQDDGRLAALASMSMYSVPI